MNRGVQDVSRLILAFMAAWLTSGGAVTMLIAKDALDTRGSLWPEVAFAMGGALILISSPAMLMVGLPSFLLFRPLVRGLPGRTTVVGALAGMVFVGGWLVLAIRNPPAGLLIELLPIISQAGAVGAASGFAFWLVAYSSYGPWRARWRRDA